MNHIANWFKSIKKELFVAAVLDIAVGVIMIMYPDEVSHFICYVIGGLFILCGGFSLVNILVNKGTQPFTFRVIPAALAVAVGFLFVFGADFVFDILWIFIGVGIIMKSYFKSQFSYELKYAGAPKWWINLVISMISLCLGIVLILERDVAQTTIIMLSGIFMIIDGICDLATVMTFVADHARIRNAEKKVEKAIKQAEKERVMQEKLSEKERKAAAKAAAKAAKHGKVIDLEEVVTESKAEVRDAETVDAENTETEKSDNNNTAAQTGTDAVDNSVNDSASGNSDTQN